MPKININGREYELDDMSDEAKGQIGMIQMVEIEIRRLDGQIAIHKTARGAYERALIEAFPVLTFGDKDTIEFN